MRSARVVSNVIRMMLGRVCRGGLAPKADPSRRKNASRNPGNHIEKGSLPQADSRNVRGTTSSEDELQRKVHVARATLGNDRVAGSYIGRLGDGAKACA